MRRSSQLAMVLGLALISAHCAAKKSSSPASAPAPGAPAVNANGSTGTGDAAAAGAGTPATTSAITADNYPEGFYTGISGTTGFPLLLPGFRKYTVADTSVAKIEAVTVTVPQATLDSLNAVLAKLAPPGNSSGTAAGGSGGGAGRKFSFPAQQTVYKLTPLKAGTTTISAPAGSRGGSGAPKGGGKDAWSKSSTQTLTVTTYTDAQVAKGKARYNTDHDSSNPACASCHLTGKDGAPPHALGSINSIPDVAAEQWVTTGKLGGRTAKIPHAWKFADADEELSTIIYVRTLETNDAEQLILLQFAQRFGLTLNADGTFSGTVVDNGAPAAPAAALTE